MAAFMVGAAADITEVVAGDIVVDAGSNVPHLTSA
jgi:hypothetical protein